MNAQDITSASAAALPPLIRHYSTVTAALLPARADTVSLYRRIRGGHVAAADLQPVFAAEGPQNTGKTLASLTALQELGLIEEQEGRWLPVPVTAKQDLASAPVLQKLAELAKQA